MSRPEFLEKAKELLELGRQASTETGGDKVREVCLKFARSLSTIDFKMSEQMVQVFTNGNNFVPSSGAGRFNRVSPARKKKLQEAQRMQEAARAKLSNSPDLVAKTQPSQAPNPTPPPQIDQSQTDGADGEKLGAVVDLVLQEANEAILQEEFDFGKDPDVKIITTLSASELRTTYNSESIKVLEEKFMAIYPDMGLGQYNHSRQKLAAIRRYLLDKKKQNA